MDVLVSGTIDQKTYLKKFRGASASLDPPRCVYGTIITNILNAAAGLQLEFGKNSQDLLEHPTNKNPHNYLQNHIKPIST